jgi:SAM-dependent methyltransferase
MSMIDPKTRFSNRVGDYARYRPTYPPETIAAILDGFHSPVAADLGAGTGISAHLLRDAGASVYAVEPNAAMRDAIAEAERVIVVDASAECTSLDDASVDIVTAFQAYHWFDPDAVLKEARRITREGGRFAAVWNHRDRNDPFTGAYEAIVDRYDESAGGIDRDRRSARVLDDLRRHGWRNPRVVTARHRYALDWEAMIGLARSASYLPKTGEAYESMARELRDLFDSWPSEKAFTYVTDAYLAERPAGE